jgi:hypothetical protein
VELAPKDPEAVAVQFTHYKDMTDEERARRWAKGAGHHPRPEQPVSGLGRLMPKAATAEVQAGLPFTFNLNHFAAAWRRLKVGPQQE